MNIALLPNLTRPMAKDVTREICLWLTKYKADFSGLEEERDLLSDIENIKFYDFDTLIDWCDVIITVGGDGSMLRAAKRVVDYEKPILCINAGHLAFMAGLEREELNLLENLTNGNYIIDKRMLLEVEINRKGKPAQISRCINDAVLARGDSIKVNDIDVKCAGRLINKYRSDGIIVATPTGSSAYSLAAGGPVINPNMEAIVVTPISCMSLFARSIVFSPDDEIELTLSESSPTKELLLSLDGNDSIFIHEGDIIKIRKSPYYANFIRIKSDHFFEILNKKLVRNGGMQ